MSAFAYRDGELHAEGVPLSAIAAKYGTLGVELAVAVREGAHRRLMVFWTAVGLPGRRHGAGLDRRRRGGRRRRGRRLRRAVERSLDAARRACDAATSAAAPGGMT